MSTSTSTSTSQTTLLLPPLASGAIFGAALTLSRVYLPSVILQQLQLTNFHMMQSFITASACSALVVAAANGSGFARLAPRSAANYGRLGFKYDANVVGGALQGLSMVLTGACPGTVLVQFALGVGAAGQKGAWRIALGGLLAGILFVRYGASLKRQDQKQTQKQKQKHTLNEERGEEEKLTVQQKTGLSTASTILIYEIACLAMLAAASFLTDGTTTTTTDSTRKQIPPIVGGLLIGLAQATSVLFTRKTIGVSSAYEDLGRHFWSLFPSSSSSSHSKRAGGWSSIVFALGIMGGAKAISIYSPGSIPPSTITNGAGDGTGIGFLTAVAGGFLSIFGARVAGGCTSGHGISGMATMSLSSFVTAGAMFGTGILAARTLMVL